MNVWLVWDDDYILAAFSSEETANEFARERRVEEITVYGEIPPKWTYWHRGASVYPDGSYEEWTVEHEGELEVSIPPVDDHLHNRAEPWDGHTQGHCGEHISIFGTDKDALEAAFQTHLAAAIARQDGTCHARFHTHRGDVDGVTIYEADWRYYRRAGTPINVEFACMQHFEHDWGEWTDWRDVENGQNRQRVCKRCVTLQIGASFHFTAAQS